MNRRLFMKAGLVAAAAPIAVLSLKPKPSRLTINKGTTVGPTTFYSDHNGLDDPTAAYIKKLARATRVKQDWIFLEQINLAKGKKNEMCNV